MRKMGREGKSTNPDTAILPGIPDVLRPWRSGTDTLRVIPGPRSRARDP